MSVLSPALDAELSKDRATIFGAVAIDFAAKSVRLLDGSAVISFGGQKFRGDDPDYGSLESIDDFTDGAGDQAPGFSFTLLPPSEEAALLMSQASDQGARVRLWFGARDDYTGLVIGEPLLLADAEQDVPTLNIGPGEHSVSYDCVSAMERFFDNDEGINLSPTWHKTVWPGELGMDYVTGVTEPVYWGLSHNSAVQAG
jgi:hypothetical protein